MKNKLLTGVGIIMALLVIILGTIYRGSHQPESFGSIDSENGYMASSTKSVDGTAIPKLTIVKNGPALLGSLVVVGEHAEQVINFYDATTTNVLLRTPTQPATTTIAAFATSTPGGTYTIDANTRFGLIVEVIGAVGTSTYTHK